MIHKWLKIAFFLEILSCSLFAQNLRLPSYNGMVNDFANIIPSGYEEKMESLAREVRNKTGAEMAVATVKDMGGLSVGEYAVQLYEKWGIGQKGKDNGVLFLLAMAERKVRIEVGYGLEGILPDGLCGEILDVYAVPSFREGDYGRGFYLAILKTADVIAKDAGVQITGSHSLVQRRVRQPSQSGGGSIISIIIFIFLVIVTRGRILKWLFLAALLGGGRGGGFSGGGGFGGGFGGFGGGMSGGGGASRGF